MSLTSATTTTSVTTTSFAELGLNADLLQALSSSGYTTPTPIQAQAIPGVLAGRDLMGIAQTGTGKTAAFALPILHRLAADKRPPMRQGARVLVLSPTRELATQIGDSFRTYGKHTGLSVTVMFGGMPFGPQVKAMRSGVDVLVATPGRLLDHIDQRSINLSGTEIVVLDEADQMLDMGFIAPIRKILKVLSQRRQSLFFSATMPREIGALAGEMLRDPLRVQVTPVAKTADRVRQSVIHVEPQKKSSLLIELFGNPALKRTIVFTRTKRGADKVTRHLEAAGISAVAIHGNKSQRQREVALDQFRAGRIRGLIATDIAARGIDIDEVTHVINFELPEVPESYVHRIGRTARAGAEGIAISLCSGDERGLLRDIERVTRQSIPASDRTGDTTLAANAQVSSGERGQRQQSGGQRGNGGGRPAHGLSRGGYGAGGSGNREVAHRESGRRGDMHPSGDRPAQGERRAHDARHDAGPAQAERRDDAHRAGGRPAHGQTRGNAPRGTPRGHADGAAGAGQRDRREDGRGSKRNFGGGKKQHVGGRGAADRSGRSGGRFGGASRGEVSGS